MLTKAHTRRTAVELVLFMLLAVGGGLLFWGGSFAKNMVHDQLIDQKISFPAKGSPALDAKEFPGLQRYAGEAVDNGPKAKAYANQFIAAHLDGVAGGKTYSQVSELSRANPSDTKLAGQVQTAVHEQNPSRTHRTHRAGGPGASWRRSRDPAGRGQGA